MKNNWPKSNLRILMEWLAALAVVVLVTMLIMSRACQQLVVLGWNQVPIAVDRAFPDREPSCKIYG